VVFLGENVRAILVDERRTTIMVTKATSASSVRLDQTGKAFMVLCQGMRQCLVCDKIFTRQAAAAHAGTVCYPLIRNLKVSTGRVPVRSETTDEVGDTHLSTTGE
jgi:hypothetical protein